MILAVRPLSRLAAKKAGAATGASPTTIVRLISVGTDLTSSPAAWQRSRPWHLTDADGSNLASDNAVSMTDLFRGRKVAVFGVPAPFTGTCTNAHVPGYKALADEFGRRGVDEVVCYSVTDPYAHHNWAEAMGVDKNKISFMADVDGSWAKENELDRDYTGASLGVRSSRFSMMVEDGVVKSFNADVEDAEGDAAVLLGQA
eukprot:CAMPEP_0172525820 /NCGR_PEP_ID=MMETSP1067-20121228/841_1 /TAXON_ID=265564 ORGANISM="Thalassiosira punctigera, Strain Tpunct2005C2" /NCGR_SAMPLE_ID=MMETSP1067 /ASSEMBLY_ACC=CAM_ASM_000444 /LENGTH=200 /DNA_ID=CAMNT_0013309189 /DNA_START=60 /DNA_END=662 /DNA_ORIENTATION=+